jgi:prolyl oligopeptidase
LSSSTTALVYWRRRAPAPGDTRADWFKHSASHLHVLGGDPDREAPVFSPLLPGLDIRPMSFSHVRVSPRSRWALVLASPGTIADAELFVAPLAKVAPGTTPWRRITGPTDHVIRMIQHGDTLYALSYADAPRRRVLAIDAAKGTLASAKVFVAEGSAVIQQIIAAEDQTLR